MMPSASDSSRVTVLLVTYNQEKYIEDALRALLAQDIEGPTTVVVADDASDDGTLDVIASYQDRDPRFTFTVLDHATRRGTTRNYQRAFAACTTQYVATLEGDDYWTRPEKLRRQRDFLDEHQDCSMCAVNYLVYEEPLARFTPRTTPGSGYRLLTGADQISDNLASNFSTSMYRLSALQALPARLFELTSYDWIVNICVGRDAHIGFLEEPMSVYRLHPGGVWTGTPYVEQVKAQLDAIPDYDALTGYVYHEEFDGLARHLTATLAASDMSSTAAAPAPTSAASTGPRKGGLKRILRRMAGHGSRR